MFWNNKSAEPADSDATAWPSPQSPQEFEQLADTVWKDLTRLISEESAWKPLTFECTYGTPDIEIMERPTENGTAIPYLKAFGTIPCSAEELFGILTDPDLENRREWEKELIDGKNTFEVNKNIAVLLAHYKAPFPVTNREFLAIRCKRRFKGPIGEAKGPGYAIYGTSISHPDYPPSSSYVRAGGKTAFFITPVEGKTDECHCVRFVYLDPKGNIPQWIINSGKVKAAVFFILMRKYIDKRREAGESLPRGELPEDDELAAEETSQPSAQKAKEKATRTERKENTKAAVKTPTKKDKQKKEKEKEAEHYDEDNSEGEADDDGDVFVDASNQFPWREDFDQQTERIATLVANLQHSLERIDQRLNTLERSIVVVAPGAARQTAPTGPSKSLLSFTRLSWGSIAFLFAWPSLVWFILSIILGRKLTK